MKHELLLNRFGYKQIGDLIDLLNAYYNRRGMEDLYINKIIYDDETNKVYLRSDKGQMFEHSKGLLKQVG